MPLNPVTPLRRLQLVLAALCAALLVGCSSTPKDVESQWSANRLYAEAKEEAAQGNFDRAGKLYERLEGRASGTALAQQAEIERAYMLYRGGEKAQALTVLDRFIKLHPTSPGLDYALYLKGLVNFNDDLGLFGRFSGQNLSERDQQASRDAYQTFKRLIDQFPQSIYADDARVRMDYIVNSLAAHEVHVARYYFRRGAYVAAANRAQVVVSDFQYSPSTEEALSIMVRSYDRLGLTELRDDAKRVLRKNFPATEVATQGPRDAKSAWWQVW